MPDISRDFGTLTYKLSGLADLERALEELSIDLRKRVILQALRDAVKPMVKVAQAIAQPRDYASNKRVAGTLRKAITAFKSKRYKASDGAIGVYITVRASKAQRRARPVSGDPYYWRWVVGGHKAVGRFKGKSTDYAIRGRGRLTGISVRRRAATKSTREYPILEQAFRAQSNQALEIFQTAVITRIAKANQRK